MLHHFLGIEVVPTPTGIFLTQRQYILHILESCKMHGAKEATTPMCTKSLLSLTDGTSPADATQYRRTLGLLQYLSFTQPDISFAVNRLSEFMHAPTETHWQGVKRILRYLKGTLDHGLFLRRSSPLTLSVFSNSDWGGVTDGGKSTTAYVLYLGGNIISWKSAKLNKKQCAGPLLKLNTRLLQMQVRKCYGYEICSPSWEFH
ncbi:unnamed protein product [Cuscuta epithymum]|uniref:Reverse transcriptase Ty1/copia-type domain-containing protein n=1 Tax=Cuscuta epithymum TaxID=186058 RepID=A0AAV0EW27_9ASTE|nr:unnamed protein product [Cuscuta epithymum]